MLKKFNLKERAVFYAGLLLFVAGLTLMPPHAVTQAILAGALSFMFILLIALPLTLLSLHFSSATKNLFGLPDNRLEIVIGLAGLLLALVGIVRSEHQLVDWGTFLVLVSCELKLLNVHPSIKEHSVD